ncbi:MAG: carboxypeptidase-like regulatory domain-containing protein [Patescibacteria group bacterium]|nr:carboxypeptidase-like regulatory domain-containing protein [Patescibacteria group bacterium]
MLKNKLKLIFLIGFAMLLSPGFVFASSTSGTVDSSYKYGWSDRIGWINFGNTNGAVSITDSELSGYAWSENYGWINLNPTKSGVKNNNNGTLSGNAWGENVGWIDFSGVTINSSGKFGGTATGDVIGTLTFDCDNCDTRTDWRPRTARPACNNSTDDDRDGKIDYPSDSGCDSLTDTDETDSSGGGNIPSAAYSSPSVADLSIVINNGDVYTDSDMVVLKLSAGTDTDRVAISNTSDFVGANLLPFQNEIPWTLMNCKYKGQESGTVDLEQIWKAYRDSSVVPPNDIECSVYAKFYTQWGRTSDVYSDSIIFRLVVPTEDVEEEIITSPVEEKPVAPTTPKEKTILERIREILSPILPGFLKPKLPTHEEIVPIEKMVSKIPPYSMRGKYVLMPEKQIRQFVFAPLPKSISQLAKSFPRLSDTFNKLGIKRMSDVSRLNEIAFSLPGFSETVATPKTGMDVKEFGFLKGLPLAKLNKAEKNKLPSEIIFAKSGGELIDFNMILSVDNSGRAEEKITTIAGKEITLIVKPDGKVRGVKGYLVYRSKRQSVSQQTMDNGFAMTIKNALFGIPVAEAKEESFIKKFISEIPFSSVIGSIIFQNPALAQPEEQPVRLEEKLVLQEFDYADPEKDGIYTAVIQAPVMEGEYEIITVMDYIDPDLGKRQIRLIAVIDPEGYVFEKMAGKEARIPGVIVTINWFNPSTHQYELWPAKDYQQDNPQITDITGKYSFLVPEGTYYVRAEAPGYLSYEGRPFEVKEGSGVHFNIEMKTKNWWLKMLDWKTCSLILVAMLLAFNFYKDRKRGTT